MIYDLGSRSGDMSFNYSGKRRQYGVCYLATIAKKGWAIAQYLLSLGMAIDSVIELAINGLCGSVGCVLSTESDKNLRTSGDWEISRSAASSPHPRIAA
jgi:hypothetical protein